ncbi:DUF4907 domain-containing protein [Dyadobacter bucti]|uniref:DUF4907 domain-containing protein n=1 Tax=Dyadobacter bucti TaxID=2572203 RepID=UPI001E560DCF|nr:DUF4907 domain-containing protein [Dyadobacter bucti]
MIKKNKFSIVLISLLAFAVAAYFLLPLRKGNPGSGSEGLRNLKVQSFHKETGWGYRIYQDTTIIIEQQFIPGVSGTKGFDTEESAIKTGELVENKILHGIFPPTVSPRDLDSLRIKY